MGDVIAKHLLKILWLGLLLGFLTACGILLVEHGAVRYLFWIFLGIGVFGILIWTYLTIRIWEFRKKMVDFVERLLAGNYEVGVQIEGRDEASDLVKLLSELGEQLRTYDRLRADRVSLNYRGLDLIYRTVSEGLILADMEKRVFRLNPAAQSLFNIKQEKFSFDAVENQEANRGFMILFEQATDRDRVPQEGPAVLQLPMRDAVRDLFVRIIPLKDAQEVVKLAFIFLRPGEATEPIPVE